MYIDNDNRNFSKSFDITVSQGDINILATNISFQGDKIFIKKIPDAEHQIRRKGCKVIKIQDKK